MLSTPSVQQEGPKTYRHRCYCCVGKTSHESGPCATCGCLGYLVDPAETLSDLDVERHLHIIEKNYACKLTEEEKSAAIAFITAGEPKESERHIEGR